MFKVRYMRWLKARRIPAIKPSSNEFRVFELPHEKIFKRGDYAIYLLRKIDRSTLEVVEEIRKLDFVERVDYAGLKDKAALTTQFISVKLKRDPRALERVEMEKCKLKFLWFGRKLAKGLLNGNLFDIWIRTKIESEKKLKQQISKLVEELKERGFPNYFGPQRFGKNLDNHVKGYRLVKGEYRARKGETRERLNFYLHALQSFCFNEALSLYIKKIRKPLFRKVKLLGYDTKLGNSAFDRCYKLVLKRLKLKLNELHVPLFRLTAREGKRAAFVKPVRLSFEVKKNKVRLTFILPPGSYATVLLNELFKFE